MIDGASVFGQYSRIIRMNLPRGAGSQLASLSLPGDAFCIRMSSDPSALNLNAFLGLTVYLFSGLSTKKYLASYIVTDQKPFAGGVWPFGKCMTYFFEPSYGFPLPSTWEVG